MLLRSLGVLVIASIFGAIGSYGSASDVTDCLFCAWEVCGSEDRHVDLEGTISLGPAIHTSGCDESRCSAAHHLSCVGLTTQDVASLLSAYDSGDANKIIAFLNTEEGPEVYLNEARMALQVTGCDGVPALFLPLTPAQIAAVRGSPVAARVD